jgi:hypothetical protein
MSEDRSQNSEDSQQGGSLDPQSSALSPQSFYIIFKAQRAAPQTYCF